MPKTSGRKNMESWHNAAFSREGVVSPPSTDQLQNFTDPFVEINSGEIPTRHSWRRRQNLRSRYNLPSSTSIKSPFDNVIPIEKHFYEPTAEIQHTPEKNYDENNTPNFLDDPLGSVNKGFIAWNTSDPLDGPLLNGMYEQTGRMAETRAYLKEKKLVEPQDTDTDTVPPIVLKERDSIDLPNILDIRKKFARREERSSFEILNQVEEDLEQLMTARVLMNRQEWDEIYTFLQKGKTYLELIIANGDTEDVRYEAKNKVYHQTKIETQIIPSLKERSVILYEDKHTVDNQREPDFVISILSRIVPRFRRRALRERYERMQQIDQRKHTIAKNVSRTTNSKISNKKGFLNRLTSGVLGGVEEKPLNQTALPLRPPRTRDSTTPRVVNTAPEFVMPRYKKRSIPTMSNTQKYDV